MLTKDERRRMDFLQLIQTGVLLYNETEGVGALPRLMILAEAQRVPVGQLPKDLGEAAHQFLAAGYAGQPPPPWAETPENRLHLLAAGADPALPVPACAPSDDFQLYRGVRITDDPEALTCPRCKRIAAERARTAAAQETEEVAGV